MFSKNNLDNPKSEREYFDRPIIHVTEGFEFTPVHKRPIEMN